MRFERRDEGSSPLARSHLGENAMLTFNQIEELWQGNKVPSRSLQSAARNVGIDFEQCQECKGHGYTKATLLASMTAIEALSKVCPGEPVPIQYDRCERCHGDGGWLVNV